MPFAKKTCELKITQIGHVTIYDSRKYLRLLNFLLSMIDRYFISMYMVAIAKLRTVTVYTQGKKKLKMLELLKNWYDMPG